MITNAAAARITGQDDHVALWQWANEALAAGAAVPRELSISTSTYPARCEPVHSDAELVGAIIRISRQGGKLEN